MPLLTRAEAKHFIQEVSTGYDALIDTWIPIVQADIIEYCNNAFRDRMISRRAVGGIAFVRGSTLTSSNSPDRITDDDEELSTNEGAGFKSGMDIIVEGSVTNDGVYTVDTVSSAALSILSTGVFISQDQDDYYTGAGQGIGAILISRVSWPKPLKPIAAKMIWSQISDAKPGNVQSESIGDYSVTYVNGNAYPDRVVRGLDKWRNAVLI